mgnify:FL=1
MELYDDIRYMEWNKDTHKLYTTPNTDILKTLTYNLDTQWTDDTLPKQILEYGKKPPLGICDLHKLGITGKGVNVAIIDQPLALDHPEYKGKIKEYKLFCPKDYDMPISSMHGPSVTSFLVGTNTGVAPDAKVYFAGVPMWLGDAQYEAQALKWIIETNKKLSEHDKIKFVSVSAAPGDNQAREHNSDMWNKVVEEAENNGICVVDCTEGHRFVSVGFVDYDDGKFKYGFPNRLMKNGQDNQVHVPNSLRTSAESYDNKTFSYAYWGTGGLSWGIPYAVGVMCLAQSVNPSLSALEIKKLLIDNANQNNHIINPTTFIKNISKELIK